EGVLTPRWVRPAARWIFPAVPEAEIAQLQNSLRLPRVAAAVLVKRGYSDPTIAAEFLSPKLELLHNPLSLRDMEVAVRRLFEAIRRREPVLICGDYDVDGTVSVVILKRTIELLGGIADFHIPHRLKEGYGMRTEVVERAAQSGVRLIISVDTGIRAVEAVRHAKDAGIDVIVTDHHLPDAELPPALAILNPNRPDCPYPFKDLCGAGVTFKLVQALLRHSDWTEARQSSLLDSLLKPVAMATVADIVPLIGENRVIVRRGLLGFRDVRNLGLRALLRVAGFEEGECPSAYQVAFRLAPRINAAGRMANARDVIELFLTEDHLRAQELAGQLDAFNRERQEAESEILKSILKQCEDSIDLSLSALVFSGEDWHPGVLGIVASRLVERFCRPVFVLSRSQNGSGNELYLTGSGRSIPGFHLLGALESMGELFSKFGGHKQAAGLTLPASQLAEFRRRFSDFAADYLTADDMRPQHSIDALVRFEELTDVSVQQLLALGPFGFGNPVALLCTTDVEVAGPPRVVNDGKLLNVPLRHHGRLLVAKAWNFEDRSHLFQPGNKLDVVFQVEDDSYSRKRGYTPWCLSLKDVQLKKRP
ncbi:MAG: single-stranded-DNA-specific exonuclease RecJ, partial [Acidobacteriaceae bacterium]|nr:single-stranded-DNA-specific exonuclease RecJ [Acidobacteriaceae bacterium]